MANHINLTNINTETLETANRLFANRILEAEKAKAKDVKKRAEANLADVMASIETMKTRLVTEGESEVEAISKAYAEYARPKKVAETLISEKEEYIKTLTNKISENKKAALAIVPDSLYNAYKEGMDINKIEQNHDFLVATIEFLTSLGLGGKSEVQIVKFAKSLTVWCGGGTKTTGKAKAEGQLYKAKAKNTFKEHVLDAFFEHGRLKGSFIWTDDTHSKIRVATPEDFEETTENKAE